MYIQRNGQYINTKMSKYACMYAYAIAQYRWSFVILYRIAAWTNDLTREGKGGEGDGERRQQMLLIKIVPFLSESYTPTR